jgi:phosphatidylserine/phosphatidylglycerophosphate/cardiolipin synthase-like enzyme
MKPLLALAFALVHFAATAATNIQVYFSPNGQATAAITNALAQAKKTVLVQAYSFTSAPIAGALRDAHRRGVKVTVILDDSQKTANYSSADFLHHAGIATFTDGKHAIAHNKVMILDGATVITGSFNFTKAAEEKNAENLLIIQDAELANKYARNWAEHLKHSEHYTGKTAKR